MTGFAGIWQLDGRPLDAGILAAMARRLVRGPGLVGAEPALWNGGEVALLQSEIPGRSCIARSCEGLAVAASTRLDNAETLRRVLGSRAAGAAADPDLLLCAYERWGLDLARHLEGDFAFVLWDPARRRIVCGRDRFGVRPLLYHFDPARRLFACASWPGPLTGIVTDLRLDEERVAHSLVRAIGEPRRTFFRQIQRLLPARVAVVDGGGVRDTIYWELDPEGSVHLRSGQEYADRFRELFGQAVRRRLPSAHPVACALSGGLDSSSIACVAAALPRPARHGPVHGLTAVFPSLPAPERRRLDECRYAREVADRPGLVQHEIRADLLSPLHDIDDMLGHLEEPFLAPNLYLHWALYRTARAAGCQVFLDGIDGDTTVSHGLSYLPQLLAAGRWLHLWREVTALGARVGSGRRRLLWRHGVVPLVEDWWARLGPAPDPCRGRLIQPDLAQRTGVAPAPRRRAPRGIDRARADHWEGLTSPLYPHAFELADRAGAAFGVEPAYPFFDRELVEFCLAVPSAHKLSDGWTRPILRRAMAGILPESVRCRPGKADLSPNFLLRLVDEDAPLVDAAVREEGGRLSPFVDPGRLRQAWSRCRADPRGRADDAMDVVGAVVLALWLRRWGLQA